jgi:hypothetical protein
MAGANSNINFVGLDFNNIKNNLKTFLQSQDTFKDYNFDGSGLSVLLDVLSYNTQYNAFYLNMVANEMFLDTALQRPSVVSHAKLMNYTPQSKVAPTAFANIEFYGVNTSSFTLPSYTTFLSESVDGVNYHFTTIESQTVNTDVSGNAIFNNVELKQGIPVNYSYVVDSTTNPNYVFELPDADIDTSTIVVSAQVSTSNSSYQVFTESSSYLTIDGNSPVYFVEESLDGNYQISFGDGILGKQLTDGNVLHVSYITTQGVMSHGANNFVLMDSINNNYSGVTVQTYQASSSGKDKESIDSIKYQAPKSFSAQNRAVTKDDYITLIQRNNLGVTFDAVNVWGGEENDPPIYGQVFICLKPSGSLSLTSTQKQELITKVIKPISVVTVEPYLVDPDYTFITMSVDVRYNPKLTNYSASQISDLIKTTINQYSANNLNTFNSTFSSTDVAIAIKNSDPSIITSDIKVNLQKKFYPNLTNTTTYNLLYNTTLERGVFTSGISNSPTLTFYNPASANNISGVYLEEIPSATSGIQNIEIINPGYSYQVAPTVTISGDGAGASAYAVLNNTNGSINSIQLTSSGNNYTYAVVTITPASYDTTGTGAAAIPVLLGSLGDIRTYYYNVNNVKTVLDDTAGTIDYSKGIVSLIDFNPVDVNNPLGQLSISATPKSDIISSTFNTIIAIDPFDPNAIVVNVTAQ